MSRWQAELRQLLKFANRPAFLMEIYRSGYLSLARKMLNFDFFVWLSTLSLPQFFLAAHDR